MNALAFWKHSYGVFVGVLLEGCGKSSRP